jgi:uncharacterized coiled-coil protein SlyX
MSVTIVEKYQIGKSGKISIKPYFDPSISNMGLENYQMSLMDGVYHEEQLACLEINGIKRYVTGLNEFAPEVKMLPADERAAKIREIRDVVASLEQDLAANVIDPESKDFWKEVKLLRPDNDEFWSKITLKCGNDPVFLDPVKDPYDLIKLYAIEAGGFSIVTKSLEAARSKPTPPKFFLDKLETTAANRTEISKLRNKALAELQKMYDKQANKMFLVAKVVDANSTQYTKNTPNDIIYENMDNYINGLGVDRDKRKTAQVFLDAARLSMEVLKLKAIVKDATQYRMITTKSDGMIYDLDSGTALGRTPSDVVAFLQNPLNEEVMMKLMSNVEGMWNS